MNDLLLYAVIGLCMLALAFILWNSVKPSRRVKVRNLGGGASENSDRIRGKDGWDG
jgi:hypothetical protein